MDKVKPILQYPKDFCLIFIKELDTPITKNCTPTHNIHSVWAMPNQYFFFLFIFKSRIYNVGLTRSLWAAHTNTEYSMTMLRSARLCTTRNLKAFFWRADAGKVCALSMDDITLLSGSTVKLSQLGCCKLQCATRLSFIGSLAIIQYIGQGSCQMVLIHHKPPLKREDNAFWIVPAADGHPSPEEWTNDMNKP
jgi:hypothetical protein